MSAMALPPYATLLGIRMTDDPLAPGFGPVLAMDFANHVEGKPGTLHGGATGGLMDMAATIAVASALSDSDSPALAKPIGMTIDYMRPGLQKTSYARGRVTRIGNRVATIVVEAWQDDPKAPIALARVHMLIDRAAPPSV
jgi:uncharacterized protein (TIGR00369 family)